MSPVAEIHLHGKRALVLGAETEIGRAIASALAAAGADVAAVASTTDAEAAFAVQRLARRLAAPGGRALAQAIDATNEAALRVMTRQVSKELGGLDAFIFDLDAPEGQVRLDEGKRRAIDHAIHFGGKELDRWGEGALVVVMPGKWSGGTFVQYGSGPAPKFKFHVVGKSYKSAQQVADETLQKIVGDSDNG